MRYEPERPSWVADLDGLFQSEGLLKGEDAFKQEGADALFSQHPSFR